MNPPGRHSGALSEIPITSPSRLSSATTFASQLDSGSGFHSFVSTTSHHANAPAFSPLFLVKEILAGVELSRPLLFLFSPLTGTFAQGSFNYIRPTSNFFPMASTFIRNSFQELRNIDYSTTSSKSRSISSSTATMQFSHNVRTLCSRVHMMLRQRRRKQKRALQIVCLSCSHTPQGPLDLHTSVRSFQPPERTG